MNRVTATRVTVAAGAGLALVAVIAARGATWQRRGALARPPAAAPTSPTPTAALHFNASAVCQCGSCKAEPFCSDAHGAWRCDRGGAAPCACDGPGEHWARAVRTRDRTGAPQTLYCEGPAAVVPPTQPAVVSSPYAVDPCLFTDADLRALAPAPERVWSELPTRAARCGQPAVPESYGCDLGGRYPWAAGLRCPAVTFFAAPRVCITAASEAQARESAQTLFGAHCALPGDLSREPTRAEGPGVWTCFPRDEPGALRVAASACATPADRPVAFDPGVPAVGFLVATDTTNESVLRVRRPGAGAYSAMPLGGYVWVFGGGDYIALSDALLLPTARATVDGAPTEMFGGMYLGRPAGSHPGGGPGLFAFDGQTTFGARVRVGSTDSWVWFGTEGARARRVGDEFSLDLHQTDAAANLEFELHLSMRDAFRKASARIVSAPRGPVECTSPTATPVPFEGVVSAEASPVLDAGFIVWTDVAAIGQYSGLAPQITFPLLRPDAHPFLVDLVAQTWPGANDAVEVRVVDTTPPHIERTELVADCGWGSAAHEPDPSHPALCLRLQGVARDACSTPTTEIVEVRAVSDGGDVVWRETNPPCVRPAPGFLDAGMTRVHYEVVWRATDSWGLQANQRAVVRVEPDGARADCAEARRVVLLDDAPAR